MLTAALKEEVGRIRATGFTNVLGKWNVYDLTPGHEYEAEEYVDLDAQTPEETDAAEEPVEEEVEEEASSTCTCRESWRSNSFSFA